MSKTQLNETIHICLSCDDNYAMHTASTISSIISNASKGVELVFYILNKSLYNLNKERLSALCETEFSRVEFVQINPDDFSDCPIPKGLHFSVETYFRLKIAALFQHLDKVLYLDSDITVLGDVKELWDTDVEGFYAAAAVDICPVGHLDKYIDRSQYFNAGVLLINSKKWREDYLEKKFFDFIKNHGEDIIWVDQDVLNVILFGNIKFLPREWNMEYNAACDNVTHLYEKSQIKLIHNISKDKPWSSNIKHKYQDDYFKYLCKTPWAHRVPWKRFSLFVKRTLRHINCCIEEREFVNRFLDILKAKRILIWGASKFIEDFIKRYKIKSNNIIGIIDRDEAKRGKKIGRYEIYHPSSLKSLPVDVIVSGVVNQPRMGQFIREELQNQGLEIEVIEDMFVRI